MRTLLASVLILMLLAPAAAAEGTEASDEGWRLFVPEGFQAAPPSVGAGLAQRVRRLVASTGIPLTGTPSQRQYVAFGPDGKTGTLLVIRYRMISEASVAGVSGLDLPSLKGTLVLTARELGDIEINRVDRARLNAITEGIRVTVTERSEDGAVSEFRFVLAIGSGSAVVIAFRASDDAPFDTPETWKRLLASLRITKPEPGLERWVPLVVGLLGLTVLLAVGIFFLRRSRVEPSYVMAIDPMARGVADAPDSGSRPVDGLDVGGPVATSPGMPIPTSPGMTIPTSSGTPMPPAPPRGGPPPPPRVIPTSPGDKLPTRDVLG